VEEMPASQSSTGACSGSWLTPWGFITAISQRAIHPHPRLDDSKAMSAPLVLQRMAVQGHWVALYCVRS